MLSFMLQSTSLQSNKIQNKKLFGDVAIGAFPWDTKSTCCDLHSRNEGSNC